MWKIYHPYEKLYHNLNFSSVMLNFMHSQSGPCSGLIKILFSDMIWLDQQLSHQKKLNSR